MTEERDSCLENEVDYETEEKETSRQLIDGKDIRTGMQILATQEYKNNLDSPLGEELDFNQGDTLVYLMEHEEKQTLVAGEWWNWEVGYVPVAYIMLIIYETLQKEESDTTMKEGHEHSTDGTTIGGEKGHAGKKINVLYSGSDWWKQDELGDMRGGLHVLEDRL